ncbi:hypothetical protein ACFDR9_001302 [Janthinobacterium sp. CG_23.3]|uniref:hypothetical protein n=1 Tax=Janthinobacterium sp. CG_23.3 TaxID=3349634 RepID=UPI0038D38CDB
MNSSKFKPVIVVLAVSFFTACSSNLHAGSAQASCSALSSTKQSTTVLLDESGHKIDHFKFDAGNASFSSLKNDFIFSKAKYRLVLFPASRTIENDCSLSVCVETKKIKPRCVQSNEYILSIGISPAKFGPETFRTEFDLKIVSPEGPDINRSGFSFQEIIEGTIAMPWLSTVKSPQLSAAVLSLYKAELTTIKIPIKNSGMVSYKFSDWQMESKGGKDFELLPGSCKSATLRPNTTCSVQIKKLAVGVPTTSILEWWNKFEGEGLNIRLQIEKINDNKAGITIYNSE